MEFWRHTIEPYEGCLENLGSSLRASLALRVVIRTVPLFEPALEDCFPTEYVVLVESATSVPVGLLAQWPFDAAFAEGFLARYDALPDMDFAPMVGPFMMAMVRLFEGFENLSANDTIEVLYSCYEAVLMSQLGGRITEDDERANARCSQAITLQREEILQYLRPRSAPPLCE
ncbi:hypothetical protein OH736_45460 (plasmid) [Streptomyces sp. NBC_01650]|uniref:hypothetical protein n=1 Tax=Streptomyces sp. NBC_01650 TaxID=2975907 RepID=UPI002F91B05B|nr:hypothetical protein OH736_45460 [Streptomyces sp. NBC_01650]